MFTIMLQMQQCEEFRNGKNYTNKSFAMKIPFLLWKIFRNPEWEEFRRVEKNANKYNFMKLT